MNGVFLFLGGVGVVLLGFAGWLLTRVAGDLASEEVRGWIGCAPRAILRLAAAQLNREERERLYYDEWLPEFQFIMQEAEGRPITRAFHAFKFALGLLVAARTIARFRPPTPPPAVAGNSSGPAALDQPTQSEELLINLTRHLGIKDAQATLKAEVIARAEAATATGSVPQPTTATGGSDEENPNLYLG